MRVAIVHDDLVQWGGAERVLEGLSEIYPDAPIFTSVFDSSNTIFQAKFGSKKIITSFLQKIPGWKTLYKTLLPLYPIAFEQFDFDGFDLVISHTTRFAKSIITKPETLHISYCHTPPRFLWRFSGYKSYGLGEALMSKLRLYDAIAANRVDRFIAGSENAKKRIGKVYKKDAKVVYPFVDMERFKGVSEACPFGVEGFDGGYFVVIARASGYKKTDLAIKACQSLGVRLKIIGDFRSFGVVGVESLGKLSDEEVVRVLAGCRALIICAEEDFGLTSLEAQALGKPVVAFGKGGARETVIDGKTGLLYNGQTEGSLKEALERIQDLKIDPNDCKLNAARFSKENFVRNFKQAVSSVW